jgi:hypothetical protein
MTARNLQTKRTTTFLPLCHHHHNRNNTKNNGGDYYNNCHQYRWTLVIIGVMILMTVSVVLAIVFPYRGDVLLRAGGGGVDSDVDSDVMMSSSSNGVGNVHDGIHSIGGDDKKEEDGTNGLSSEGVDNVVNDDDGSSSSVLLSGGRGDDNNEEQTSNELLSPLDDSSSTVADNMNKQQHGGGGGLFDYDSTPYDPTMQQHQQQQQQSESQSQTQSAASSINTSSSLASCQTNLQQADIDMDKIIDVSEYISFLRHYVISNNIVDDEEEVVVEENNDASSNKNLLGSVNDFEELPIEYQVNFNHLATKMIKSNSGASSSGSSSSSSGASGSNSSSYGIPIATFEEIQKVCLYLSNMGRSAIDEFDWDQISTTLKQQQNEGM